MDKHKAVPKVLTEEERQKKRALSKRLMSSMKQHVLVCNGGCCTIRGDSEAVLQSFKEAVELYDTENSIRVTATQCLSRCGDACSVVVYPEGAWYKHLKPEDIAAFVQEHLLKQNLKESHLSYLYEQGQFVSREAT
ncbi:(2Fe-2S) ferredoxin domain-containing protein [Paenibacillus lemnae]|uniref:(2Fe-2S) ferredoxin domain-containing protein n=1 Tax=Paenibacillus lemnae TaxID=1330551 RepID=A0A848MC43_PAELE|nr:(2Fe-2S) ferredoxin domain-containing protein [Paenibacillus lemnae]NMO97613.1 (2Fe-2S) ferredoxin domain-containing protein [Paenibacillus lemnae]